MTDKLKKIREEVERLRRWNDNVRNSTRHMTLQEEDFNRGKHSSYLEILNFIDSMQEEPVSEDLNEEIGKYCSNPENFITYIDVGFKQSPIEKDDIPLIIKAIEFGADWQKEQFEKNRLAACDKQTEEEAEIERDFVMGIIEKEHRQPTFDDAIKYGMRLQKEQIKEALLSEVLPYFMHGGEADEVVAKLDEVLNQKK